MMQVDGLETVRFKDAINANIITALESEFNTAVNQTRSFAQKFKGKTVKETAHNVWRFLKSHVTYSRDPSEKQMIRLPGRFVSDKTGDCKSYSLFAASVLANLGIPVAFRYASYRDYSKTPTHVYVVLPKHNLIVDGVYNTFNAEKKYSSQITHPMEVVTLSDDVNFEDVSIGKLRDALLKGGKLANGVRKGSLKHLLLINRERRKRNMKPLFIPKEKLKAALQAKYVPGNKYYQMASEELNRLHGLDEIDGVNGIGKIKLKKIAKVLKKAANPLEHAKLLYKGFKATALHGPRLAFAFLVSINYRGLASKLAMGIDGSQRDKIYKLWKRLGGARKTLDSAINKGKNKKVHFAGKKKKAQLRRQGVIKGIGAAGSITATLVAAGSVLAAFAAILKALPLKKNGDAADSASEADPETSADVMLDDVQAAGGNPTFTPGTAATDPEPGAGTGAGIPDAEDVQEETQEAAANTRTSFTPNPLLIAAAIGLFLMFKK